MWAHSGDKNIRLSGRKLEKDLVERFSAKCRCILSRPYRVLLSQQKIWLSRSQPSERKQSAAAWASLAWRARAKASNQEDTTTEGSRDILLVSVQSGSRMHRLQYIKSFDDTASNQVGQLLNSFTREFESLDLRLLSKLEMRSISPNEWRYSIVGYCRNQK